MGRLERSSVAEPHSAPPPASPAFDASGHTPAPTLGEGPLPDSRAEDWRTLAAGLFSFGLAGSPAATVLKSSALCENVPTTQLFLAHRALVSFGPEAASSTPEPALDPAATAEPTTSASASAPAEQSSRQADSYTADGGWTDGSWTGGWGSWWGGRGW